MNPSRSCRGVNFSRACCKSGTKRTKQDHGQFDWKESRWVVGTRGGTDLDGDEVLERLGHLKALDVKVTGVEEVVDPLLAVVVGLFESKYGSVRTKRKKEKQKEKRRRAHLALSHLVVVVREDQVDSSRVDVDLSSENLARHHRALDVPSRSTLTPRRRPEGLSSFRGLPESEIGRRTLDEGERGEGT